MKIRKNIIRLLLVILLLPVSVGAQESTKNMNQFIDKLMRRMTLREKIGQLNLPVTGDIITGQAKSSNISEKIRKGEVGGLFNLKGVKKIREVD